MINHKQSVAEHALAVVERERREQIRHARRVGRSILREIAIMGETDGEDAANIFFNPTVIRTRARIHGVLDKFLWITESIIEQGRKYD